MCKLKSWPANSSLLMLLLYSFNIYTFLIVNGVEFDDEFDPLIELPTSCCLFTNVNTTLTCKSKSVFNVKDYGAKGDGITDDTKIFQEVWKKACSLSSSAKIVIPAKKTYLVRQIDFPGPCKSKITFQICGGIVAPKDPKVWNGVDTHKWLYFNNVEHLTVEGGGTINGRGQEWWARSCKTDKSNPCQDAPTAITFHGCNDLKVKNIKMIDSQQMHMEFSSCVQVAASHLKISAPGNSPNTNGIHISSSSDVEVKRSDISTGDDCISIVGSSSNIRIKIISCGPGHGISIGSLGKSNSSVQVKDVIVDDILLSNTVNGVRIKTWQGGSGYAREITFQDITMKNVSNPILIDQYYCDSPVVCPNQTLAVNIESISFKDIRGTSATEEAIKFLCSDSTTCTKLYLEDIRLKSSSGGTLKSFFGKAYGSSSGEVYPPPCFTCDRNILQKNCIPTSCIDIKPR